MVSAPMTARAIKTQCAVCRSHAAPMVRWRGRAWLCPTHDSVARWIIPAPSTIDELRTLFPVKVTGPKRPRASRAA